MKAFRQWMFSIGMDVLMAAALYYWRVVGVDGAGNLFKFLVWTTVALLMLCGLFLPKEEFAKSEAERPRPRGFATYHYFTTFACVSAMAWIGMLWTAGFYLLGTFIYEGRRGAALGSEPAQQPG